MGGLLTTCPYKITVFCQYLLFKRHAFSKNLTQDGKYYLAPLKLKFFFQNDLTRQKKYAYIRHKVRTKCKTI